MNLTDTIFGAPTSDIEKGVDRYFTRKMTGDIIDMLFGSDAKKRRLETELLQRRLTQESEENNLSEGLLISAKLASPTKKFIAHLLS